MPRITRTISDCAEIAKKYDARVRFKRGDNAVYYYARKYGWLDEICQHMQPLQESRTISDCNEIAKKYDTRIDFARSDSKIYYYARYNGWLDEICQHMQPQFVFNRTKQDCHEIALKYSRPVDFLTNDSAAYKKAQSEGWLSDITSHMTYFNPITNVVYAWKIKNSNVWKIGVSNENNVEKRIKEVSSAHQVEVDVKFTKILPENARFVEKKLLDMGVKVDMPIKETGHTEFRQLSEHELGLLLNYFIGEYCD